MTRVPRIPTWGNHPPWAGNINTLRLHRQRASQDTAIGCELRAEG